MTQTTVPMSAYNFHRNEMLIFQLQLHPHFLSHASASKNSTTHQEVSWSSPAFGHCMGKVADRKLFQELSWRHPVVEKQRQCRKRCKGRNVTIFAFTVSNIKMKKRYSIKHRIIFSNMTENRLWFKLFHAWILTNLWSKLAKQMGDQKFAFS